MKRIILLAALVSAAAAAQDRDISGAQLLSGEADAALQSSAREASAQGKKLVISAPEYWHELIIEQLRKGGGENLQIEVRDSFAESVMVRAESAAPAPAPTPAPEATPTPVATPAPVATPTPAPAPRPVVTPTPRPVATPVPAPTPKPVATPTPRPVATPAPTPTPVATPAPRPVATPTPAPSPVAAPTPRPIATLTPAPATTPAATATPAAPARGIAQAEAASIRRRLEESLNRGEKVDDTIRPESLEQGDTLYVQGPVRAVVRRQSLRNKVYWLEGDLNLQRVELKPLSASRYQVMERIRPGSERLRAERSEGSEQFKAADPASASAERAQLEKRYNGGKQIVGTLAPNQLRQKDIIYLGNDLAVVVRLAGMDLERYFLVGSINLGRSELIQDGANKYKVLQDVRE